MPIDLKALNKLAATSNHVICRLCALEHEIGTDSDASWVISHAQACSDWILSELSGKGLDAIFSQLFRADADKVIQAIAPFCLLVETPHTWDLSHEFGNSKAYRENAAGLETLKDLAQLLDRATIRQEDRHRTLRVVIGPNAVSFSHSKYFHPELAFSVFGQGGFNLSESIVKAAMQGWLPESKAIGWLTNIRKLHTRNAVSAITQKMITALYSGSPTAVPQLRQFLTGCAHVIGEECSLRLKKLVINMANERFEEYAGFMREALTSNPQYRMHALSQDFHENISQNLTLQDTMLPDRIASLVGYMIRVVDSLNITQNERNAILCRAIGSYTPGKILDMSIKADDEVLGELIGIASKMKHQFRADDTKSSFICALLKGSDASIASKAVRDNSDLAGFMYTLTNDSRYLSLISENPVIDACLRTDLGL